jgi:hypothetical protein
MSEPQTSKSIISLTGLLGQIAASVAALLAYVMAITGRAPGPLPRATALGTVVITTVLLWVWRWRVMTQTKPVLESPFILLRNVKPRSLPSFHLREVLRSSNDERFILSSKTIIIESGIR